MRSRGVAREKAAGRRGQYAGFAVLLVVVLGPLGVLGCITWVMEGHGAPIDSVERVRLGMEVERVRQILGKPSASSEREDGSKWWSYDRFTWCYVSVEFSPDGLVSEIDHDH